MVRLGTTKQQQKATIAQAKAYNPFRHAAAIHSNAASIANRQVTVPLRLTVESEALLWKALLRQNLPPSA